MDPNDGAPLTESVTACQTALAALQRLGRTADADEPLDEAAATSYDSIVADTSRTRQWQIEQCAKRYTATMASLATKLTAVADIAGAQDRIDAATVFGIKGLPGDVASLSISRRDAGDRVAGITDPVQLQRLLAQAVRSGDEVLSRAIAQAAVEQDDADTTNAFIAAYPDLQPAAERLWNAARKKMTTVDLVMVWRLGSLKPPLLQPLQNYEIAAAAAAAQALVGSWNVG